MAYEYEPQSKSQTNSIILHITYLLRAAFVTLETFGIIESVTKYGELV